jgi:pyruvate,water dikinase
MILNLNTESSLTSSEFIGEKAFNLMVLNEIGLNVPSGIVLSSNFKDYYEEHGKKAFESISSELLKLTSKYIIVRSSAIGEDGDEHSFAGQLDSFQVLNTNEAIIKGVLDCWQSLENERVKTYELNSDQSLKQMGVIIQEMIEPDYAGVYFTQAPDNADDSLMEFVEGHCEKLVQGEVTPETIYGQEKFDYPFSIMNFKSHINLIKGHYQSPQDIEWLVKNDKFYFVQSRPITKVKKRVQWSSTNVNENYPDPLSPLLYSIARKSYYFYFKNLALKLGVLREGEGENYLNNIIGTWGERMYYNMTHVHGVISLSPLKDLLIKSFDDFVGYQKAKSTKAAIKGKTDLIKFCFLSCYHYLKLESYVVKIENRVDQFVNSDYENEVSLGFHEFLDIRFNFWFHASFADFFAMVFHGALGKLLTTLKLKDATGLQNSLIQSIPGLVSNKPIFELWNLKELIEVEGKSAFFKENDAVYIWKQIQTDSSFRIIKERISDYLNEWGFRCSGELCFLSTNYIENPKSFIQMLKIYINSVNENPIIQFKLKAKERSQIQLKACEEIDTNFNFFKALVFKLSLKFFIKSTMKGVSSRERVRLKQAHMYFKFKTICLRIGKNLKQSGLLSSEANIFFLEHDEISRLLGNEENDSTYLKELIKIRKDKIDRAVEKPENLYNFASEFGSGFVDLDLAETDSLLKGLPACGGKITARAVVLETIHEIDQIEKGDILITKQTDPGWICAFPIISGLVVERGGMLSHGAIVAREFGIPAVVGIKNITKTIKTGDIIEIDGDNGVIHV